MVSTNEMKLDLLAYLRYKLKYYLVATEVDMFSGIADVLAMKGGKFYEYEIKKTKADLKKDIEKLHGRKHKAYASGLEGIYFCPHYFSFVVPKNLVEDAIEFSKEHCNGKYGVILWKPSVYTKRKIKPKMKVIKRPQKLLERKHKKHKRMRTRLIMRMSSEIIILRKRIKDE